MKMYYISNVDLVAYLICTGHKYLKTQLSVKQNSKEVVFLFYPEVEKTGTDWQQYPEKREKYPNLESEKLKIAKYVESVLADENFNKANIRAGQSYLLPPLASYLKIKASPS